uniref:Uncharacterized protein n=1 Tax=Arundo donax TaxID=35708 RepID=A0A0A9HBM1_ARUDO
MFKHRISKSAPPLSVHTANTSLSLYTHTANLSSIHTAKLSLSLSTHTHTELSPLPTHQTKHR